jgi:hypothetical protein
MNNRFILASVLSALTLAGLASAQTVGNGTMGVTADISSSILVTFTTATSGLAVTGSGTSAGALPIGSVQMYGGTTATGVTKTLQTNVSYTLSTPVNVQVDVANVTSSTYTLAAWQVSADTHHTWTFNGVNLTGTTLQVDATGAYGTPNAYTFALLVPATSTNNTVSGTINFTATAN